MRTRYAAAAAKTATFRRLIASVAVLRSRVALIF